MDFPSENQNNQQYQSTYQHRYPDTYVDFRSAVALYLHKRVFERDARDRSASATGGAVQSGDERTGSDEGKSGKQFHDKAL